MGNSKKTYISATQSALLIELAKSKYGSVERAARVNDLPVASFRVALLGQSQPGIAFAHKIAQALGLTVTEAFPPTGMSAKKAKAAA